MPQRSRPLMPTALIRNAAAAGFLLAAAATPAFSSPSLQPTRAALVRQSTGARAASYTHLENDEQVHDFVRRGLLVALRDNADYAIHRDLRHAAARPEVKVFVERLARQYRDACGERLVVTSLVRPRSRQPWNSDPLSVHPTGMAIDLRISASAACRRWLEKTLLELEGDGLVEAARERVVPHYHVVVFPAYADHLQRRGIEVPAPTGAVLAAVPGVGPRAAPELAAFVGGTTAPVGVRSSAGATSATVETGKSTPARRPASTTRRYKVRRGDSLWAIARRHGTTVQAIRRANRLPSRLQPGQVLRIPAK